MKSETVDRREIADQIQTIIDYAQRYRDEEVPAGEILEDLTLRLENLAAELADQPQPNFGSPLIPRYAGEQL